MNVPVLYLCTYCGLKPHWCMCRATDDIVLVGSWP